MNNKKVAPRSKSQTGKEVKTKTKPISKTTKTVKKVKKSSTSKVKKTIVKKDEEEVKITKNVDMITRLVTNSNKILSDQNDLIERCKEISQKISSSDFLIDKALNKFNNDDYSESVDKYSYNLSNVLAKLKSHAEEVEQIKKLKEENKSLRYQLDLLSINKNDTGIKFEAKFNTFKNFLTYELNSFSEFIVDMQGECLLQEKLTEKNLDEEKIGIYFQQLREAIRKIKSSPDKENNHADYRRYHYDSFPVKTLGDLTKSNCSLDRSCYEPEGSIDNYKRNKDLKQSYYTHNNEINLENRYSDSFFYNKK